MVHLPGNPPVDYGHGNGRDRGVIRGLEDAPLDDERYSAGLDDFIQFLWFVQFEQLRAAT